MEGISSEARWSSDHKNLMLVLAKRGDEESERHARMSGSSSSSGSVSRHRLLLRPSLTPAIATTSRSPSRNLLTGPVFVPDRTASG